MAQIDLALVSRWIHFLRRQPAPVFQSASNANYTRSGPIGLSSAAPQRANCTDAGFPTQAEIVIAGGGAIGCSVAYHLAKLGWKDVLLLEQGSLSGGTTWHAAGILSKLRGTAEETRMSDYATTCIRMLEKETGQETGLKKTGGLLVARTSDRLTLLKRLLVKGRSFGIDIDMVSLKEVQERFPFARVDDLKGALWLPDESSINPTDLCTAFAKGATLNGARIYEKTEIEEVITDGRGVTGVRTDRGDIACRIFVNCSGMWARQLGMRCTPAVSIPLQPVEHFYIITQPIGADHMLPMLRDHDGSVYFREWGGGLCTGGLEPMAKPVFISGVPRHFEHQLFEEDWNQFEYLMNEILHRIPVLEKTEVRQMVNGPESFTPDGRCILGEAPNVRNYFVAAGGCANGVANSPGIGRLLSEWITEGHPSLDVSCLDIKRFARGHNNSQYLRDRISGVVNSHYSLPYPMREPKTARNLKCSPLYSLLDSAGASWGDRMGWETPNWFALGPEDHRINQGTFGRPHWLSNVEQEYRACREGLGLVDMTSTGILEIKSKNDTDCVQLLQHLCTDNTDIPVSGVIHTGMLNHEGGYELLCTLIRATPNRYLLLTKPSHVTRAMSWVTRHATDDVIVTDLQSTCAVLGILGPKSRDVLQSMTQTSLNDESFALNTCKILDIDYASGVNVIRSSKLAESEDGWQLLVPNDHVTTLYKRLKESGARDVGWYAVDTITAEKGIPALGTEMNPGTTPLEIGLENQVLRKEHDFIGKDSVKKLQDKPPSKRLAFLTMDQYDDDNFPWGGETVLRNNDIIGSVSTVVYSFAHARPVCFSFLEAGSEVISESKSLEINVAGRLYPVSARFL